MLLCRNKKPKPEYFKKYISYLLNVFNPQLERYIFLRDFKRKIYLKKLRSKKI